MQFSTTEEKIAFFFDDPSVTSDKHARKGLFSVLYLLRRELIETGGHDPNKVPEAAAVAAGVRNRLFASAILMFTGIDLLAKFTRTETGVGARFREFLKSEEGGMLDDHTTKVLYAARNSLVHAFGVPDSDELTKLSMTHIALAHQKLAATTMEPAQSIAVTNGEVAVVYVNGLYSAFVDAVARVKDSLYGADSEDARLHFEAAFAKYGTISIRIVEDRSGLRPH